MFRAWLITLGTVPTGTIEAARAAVIGWVGPRLECLRCDIRVVVPCQIVARLEDNIRVEMKRN